LEEEAAAGREAQNLAKAVVEAVVEVVASQDATGEEAAAVAAEVAATSRAGNTKTSLNESSGEMPRVGRLLNDRGQQLPGLGPQHVM
jgi:hypothetical protein